MESVTCIRAATCHSTSATACGIAETARDGRADGAIGRRSIVTGAIAPATADRAVDIGHAIALGRSVEGIGAISDAATSNRCAAHSCENLVRR